jgi:hypothetical protein
LTAAAAVSGGDGKRYAGLKPDLMAVSIFLNPGGSRSERSLRETGDPGCEVEGFELNVTVASTRDAMQNLKSFRLGHF